MAYVNTRPLAFDTNANSDSIQDTSIQLKFDFKTVLRNPTVKPFEDTDISMHGMMLLTPPSNQKVLEFNGKDYIFNYLAFTKEGDIFSDLSGVDDSQKINKLFSAVMVLSDPHYVEKLYIIHPIVEGLGVSTENRELVTVLLDILPDSSVYVDMEYDLNKFIPTKRHFFYQYRTPTNNVSSFVVIDPSFSEFNLTTTDYADLSNQLQDLPSRVTPGDLSTTPLGQIYKMTEIAKRVVQEPPENGENLIDDQIYIDCQPITDRDNKVHIMDPIRLHNTRMSSFFSLDSKNGVIYRLILVTILLLACIYAFWKYKDELTTSGIPAITSFIFILCLISIIRDSLILSGE